MIAVKGIYDGKEIKALEELPKNKKFRVLITLLEEIADDDVRMTPADPGAFSFWENEKEDLYQDYLKINS